MSDWLFTQVVKELEKKYDAMKDRLILQMLEKQMGEEEWMRLSERERQKKMMQMKIRDRQLRAAGRCFWAKSANLQWYASPVVLKLSPPASFDQHFTTRYSTSP